MAAYASSLRDPAAQRDGGNRALQVARCSLCDLERPIGLMVPDGGEACDDLRWYCKDARSCTERWTSRLKESAAESAAPQSTPTRAVTAQQREQHQPAEPERDEPARPKAAVEQHA
jgi:hypothetical protein